MTVALEITNLSKTYAKNQVQANRDITCRFEQGQVHALLGHNGAGKTTLLNQVIGLLQSDQGSITYQGQSLSDDPDLARQLVSIMPQLHSPVRGMTLQRALLSMGKMKGLAGVELDQAVAELIAFLDIAEWQDQKIEKLSGGLRRLVSFAMAVLAPAPIICLDEPTNDVDPVRRKLLWQYLQDLANRGHIVVIVTHNLLEVQAYADWYYFFHKGRLIRLGQVAELRAERKLRLSGRKLGAVEFPLPVEEQADAFFSLEVVEAQAATLFAWLGAEIAQGRIVEYELEWLDLNEVYGGWIDEAEQSQAD